MSNKEYTVSWPTEHTVLLSEEDAKRLDAKAVEDKPAAKASTAKNKAATPANKADG
jgi:hypothetical protein